MSKDEPRPGSVEELFARERALVTDLPADEDRWQRIVQAARWRRRSHRQRYAGAAAAVALLAAGVAWATTHGTGAPPRPAATTVATPGPTQVTRPAPSTSAPAPSTTGTAVPGLARGAAVPKDFTVLSLSNAGHGHVYAMGDASCGHGVRCPVLAGSTDEGRTWAVVHSFDGRTVPDPDVVGASVQPAGVLSQVRFATPETGWVFGGGAMLTRDGGRTWAPYPHSGDAVVALETDGQQVVVVTGQGCGTGSCTGQLTMATDSVAQPHGVAGGGASADLGRGWNEPVLALGGGQPVVSVWTPVGGVLLQVQDTESLSPGSQGPICRGGGAEVVTTDASAHPGLVGLCTTQGAAGSLGYAVNTSPDGLTWSVVDAQSLTLVNAGHIALAAADRSNLLAVSGGNPSIHGSLKVSHDGGHTWVVPAGAPPMPTMGWRWVGAPGGTTFYALGGPGPAYWVSHDHGDHWQKVTIG